ncbi:hypothetical protein QBC39DRAFT_348335 [Podospora conica]|nr:hypothetical protein QBC39DRAFT_348335 [Schizothecium conicum]
MAISKVLYDSNGIRIKAWFVRGKGSDRNTVLNNYHIYLWHQLILVVQHYDDEHSLPEDDVRIIRLGGEWAVEQCMDISPSRSPPSYDEAVRHERGKYSIETLDAASRNIRLNSALRFHLNDGPSHALTVHLELASPAGPGLDPESTPHILLKGRWDVRQAYRLTSTPPTIPRSLTPPPQPTTTVTTTPNVFRRVCAAIRGETGGSKKWEGGKEDDTESRNG